MSHNLDDIDPVISLSDWQAQGTILFGNDPNLWQFICPHCRTVQRPQDFLDLGMGQRLVDTLAGHACIRRWTDRECLSAGTGTIFVQITPDEPKRPTFLWNQ